MAPMVVPSSADDTTAVAMPRRRHSGDAVETGGFFSGSPSTASGGRRRRLAARSAVVGRIACAVLAIAATVWIASTFCSTFVAPSAAAWASWRGAERRRPSSVGPLSAWSAKKAATEVKPEDVSIDDVILVPYEEEGTIPDEELAPEPLPELDQDKASANRKPRVIVERRKPGAEALGSTAGSGFGQNNKEQMFDTAARAAAVADLDAAAAKLAVKPKDGLEKPKKEAGGRRWMVGRGGAKRQKLVQNTELEKWLLEKGVWVSEVADWGRESHGVAMAIETRETTEGESSGRGLIARRDINLYEELAKVPIEVLLTKNTSREIFGEEIIDLDFSPYSAIALHLIHEAFVLKEKSEWRPYIAVLPTLEDIGASFAWPEEELRNVLDGSPLVGMSLYLNDRVRTDFEEIQTKYFDKYPELFPRDAFTLDNYRWAYGILFSRAVRLRFGNGPFVIALVPYVDLINHNCNSQTYIKGVQEGVDLPLELAQKEQYVIVKADRYYSRYEQIYISYGPKSNAQLLMLYGFSLERNTRDFVELGLGHVIDEYEDLPLRDVKKKYLQDMKAPTVFPLYRDRFAQEMMVYARVLILTPEELLLDENSTEEEAYAALEKVDFRNTMGELVERRALDLIRNSVEEMFNAYPTTMDEDEAILQDRAMFEMLPKNARNAIRVRFGEKVILEATLAALDRQLANIQRITELENKEKRRRSKNAQSFWGRMGVEESDPGFRPISGIEDLMAELGME